jgi:carboxymethylenebutenolidase
VDRRIIDLYNEYVHTALPRREFLTRLASIAGSSAAAMAILPFIEPNYAQARQIEPDDKRLKAEKIEFDGPQGKVKAYVAMPRKARKDEKLPGILVIHENRGLNEHIEDVARRAAVGAVGFCYGGGLALRAAIETPPVDAAVCFYGRQLTTDETQRLKVPVLLNYAGSDERVNAGIPEFRAALDAVGVPYSLNMYPGTQHGFHNDASSARYNEAAAKLAWNRTMDFFDTYLKNQ